MATLSPVAATPSRQRLIDEMQMRRFGRETQRNYIRDVGRFATFLGRPPDTATAEEVRRFQVEQRDLGVPVPTMNSILSTEIAQNDAAAGVEALLDLVRDIHAGTIDEARLQPLLEHKPIGGVVLVTFDSASGEIVAVDPHG